jgi:hypothetical protein
LAVRLVRLQPRRGGEGKGGGEVNDYADGFEPMRCERCQKTDGGPFYIVGGSMTQCERCCKEQNFILPDSLCYVGYCPSDPPPESK